jgi:D-glycero-D-manno-heptose 1,7-bisphosphate phosphatase
MAQQRRGVFLDRDGVILEDNGLLVDARDFRILPGVPEALRLLHEAGFVLVVVSNQAVVARGLLTETALLALQGALEVQLRTQGAPPLDGFYYCPHHPSATLAVYRMDCPCRKPRPGLLLRAAQDLHLDLSTSFMVGDRPTDLQAGARAGCRTVWVQTGRHGDKPIETAERLEPMSPPAFVCDTLIAAAGWILEAR